MAKKRKRYHHYPGEGEIDVNGKTPCVGCGALVPIRDDPQWQAQIEREYPGKFEEMLTEMVGRCKTLCEHCDNW